MSLDKTGILRLQMPQWQGGDNPCYRVGGQVLAAIAPPPAGPVETVEILPAGTGERPLQHGIVSRSALLANLDRARAAIERHDPEAIVTLGGDCLCSLAPFAHLQARYGDDLAILWVDAHPDIMGVEQYDHAHAHVLGMLLGHGDPDFIKAVPQPIAPDRVLYVGLTDSSDWEKDYIAEKGLAHLSPEDLDGSNEPVLAWLRKTGARHVAVHFDLDVLDPANHDFLYFRNPSVDPSSFEGIAQGRMQIPRVLEILQAVGKETEIVGLTLAEYLPWSTMEVAQMLSQLPLLGGDGHQRNS